MDNTARIEVLKTLIAQKNRLESEITAMMGEVIAGSTRETSGAGAEEARMTGPPPKKKRRMSAAGRKAIGDATRRRWALKKSGAMKKIFVGLDKKSGKKSAKAAG